MIVLSPSASIEKKSRTNEKIDIVRANRIAKSTGTPINDNFETNNVMGRAGVPESQLLGVAGTEHIILSDRVSLHVSPSLHALIPSNFGELGGFLPVQI